MSATPVFASTPLFGFVESMTLADTSKGADLSGANVRTLLTAGSNGALVRTLRFFTLGTNVATVFRIFINNGGALNVAANNVLYAEFGVPSTFITEVSQQAVNEMSLNLALPAGYKVVVTMATAVAAGYAVSAIGADF